MSKHGRSTRIYRHFDTFQASTYLFSPFSTLFPSQPRFFLPLLCPLDKFSNSYPRSTRNTYIDSLDLNWNVPFPVFSFPFECINTTRVSFHISIDGANFGMKIQKKLSPEHEAQFSLSKLNHCEYPFLKFQSLKRITTPLKHPSPSISTYYRAHPPLFYPMERDVASRNAHLRHASNLPPSAACIKLDGDAGERRRLLVAQRPGAHQESEAHSPGHCLR